MVGDTGTDPTVLVDDIPLTGIDIGGELAFVGDDLLIASFADDSVLRFGMSGPTRTDIDHEDVIARFRSDGYVNKPLCVRAGIDGALWVTTFHAIWRLRAP